MNQSETIIAPANTQVKTRPLPPKSYLDAALEYRPETGELYWKWRPDNHFPDGKHTSARVANRFNSQFAGKIAGCVMKAKDGIYYRTLSLAYNGKGRLFLAHRVIWKILHGEFDESLQIDHRDSNGLDNRPHNLRTATPAQNAVNKRFVKERSLPRGVYRDPSGRFHAQINIKGKGFRLGTFDTIGEATAAYLERRSAIAGDFTPMSG